MGLRPFIRAKRGRGGVPLSLVSIPNRSLTEGDAGTSNMTFTLTLGAVQALDVAFDYRTEDGTATAGSDYVAVKGTKIIPAGQTSATIDVPIIGDVSAESDETFNLRISNIRYS